MIDDIKEAVESFTKNATLTARDVAGVNKIHFELDLLKDGHEKKPKKKTLKSDLAVDTADEGEPT